MSVGSETASPTAPADTVRHVRLVVVLIVLMAAISLDRAVAGLWLAPSNKHPTVWTDALFYAQQGAAYLCAGMVVDLFGVKRVVGLALILWCCLITTSGAAIGPSGLAGIHLLTILVFGVIHVAPYAAVKHGSRSGNKALVLTIPLIASFLWLLAIPTFHAFEAATRLPHADFESRRMWTAQLGATGAAFITMVWLMLYRSCDESDHMPQRATMFEIPILLADRRVWMLALVWGFAAICSDVYDYRLFYFIDKERGLSVGTVGWVVFAPTVAGIVGALVAAGWSDRIAASTGSIMQARRPFATAGFALAAALGLVPFVRQDDVLAMASIAAVGNGMQAIVGVVMLDMAPRKFITTLVGALAAFDSLVRFALLELARAAYRPAHSMGPILVVGGIAGVIGAFVVYRLLPRIEPIRDPAEERDIPAVFG